MIKIDNEKLEKSLHSIITNPLLDFWGEFALYITFQRDDKIPTAGVCIKNMKMMYYYNEDFVNSLNEKQLIYLHLHEILHLIRRHNERAVGLNGLYHNVANIAMDMLINDTNMEFYSEYIEEPGNAYYTPKEYDGEKIFEPLYEWLLQKKNKRDNGKLKSDKEIQSQSQSGEGSGDENQSGNGQGDIEIVSQQTADMIDSIQDYEFDIHLPNDVDDETAQSIVNEAIEGIKRSRGFTPSSVDEILNRFDKHKKNYIRLIQRSCNYVKGFDKNPTFKRPSRRNIKGLKGKRRIGSVINVVLDVSGSMHGEIEKVIGILFRDGFQINLVQCDTQVQKHQIIRNKREFNRLKLKGFGGTILQPGIDYFRENFPQYNTCVITDGYCDDLDFTGFNRGLLVTTADIPQLKGNVRVVKIDK